MYMLNRHGDKTELNVTDGQADGRTDRWTDGQTTCNLITALCVASRGKNDQNFEIMRARAVSSFFAPYNWTLVNVGISISFLLT